MKRLSQMLNGLTGKTGGSQNDSVGLFFFAMEEKWIQLELDFYAPHRKRKPRQPVDYDLLYERLKAGPVTFAEIEELAGVPHCSVAQIITTLSLYYPVWSPKRGVYKLMEDSDYEQEN